MNEDTDDAPANFSLSEVAFSGSGPVFVQLAALVALPVAERNAAAWRLLEQAARHEKDLRVR